MASPGRDKTVLLETSQSSVSDWATHSLDHQVMSDLGNVTLLVPADHHLSWTSFEDKGWVTKGTWDSSHAASIDFSKYTWDSWDSGDASTELLTNAFDGLETSNLNRLVRVVRDWNSAAEEAAASLIPVDVTLTAYGEAVAPEPTATLESDTTFFSLLHESNHALLEREAGKELWTWFVDWRDQVLTLAERFETLTGAQVFNLLKMVVAARRSTPRPRAPRQRQAPAERLLRIAKSIVPNAPPFPPHSEPLSTAAG